MNASELRTENKLIGRQCLTGRRELRRLLRAEQCAPRYKQHRNTENGSRGGE
jgi:hypothetical protein